MKISGILFSLVLLFLIISSGIVVLAATAPGGTVDQVNAISSCDVNCLVDKAVKLANWALLFISVIAVVVILYAGFLFMTATGDEDKLKQAKDYLQYGLIGLAVAILAFSAVALVNSLLA